MTKEKGNKYAWVVPTMVWLMRIVVGAVFAFSGLAKAIDPWGSLYKFNEYVLTLGWDSLQGVTLIAAFVVPAVEFTLGVLTMVGAYRRVVPALLLLMMLVMLPLTFWLAVSDAVPDCGCFGDALVLSNWATFGKNVTLTLGIIFLLVFNRQTTGLYGPIVQWLVATLSCALALLIAYHGYFTQPLVDFRPYKVGTRIAAAASRTAQDSDYLFVYAKDGEEHEFTIDSIPDEEDGWTFVDRRPVKRNKPQESGAVDNVIVHQLAIFNEGIDVSEDVLVTKNQLLLLFPDMQDVSMAHTFMINELTEYAQKQGVDVYGICSASEKQIAEWKDITMAEYPIFTADDSELKMVARGNPAVVFVSDGIIRWKRTLGSIEDDRLHDAKVTVATLNDDYDVGAKLGRLFSIYGLLMLALLLVNRTHVVIGRLLPKKKPVDEDGYID